MGLKAIALLAFLVATLAGPSHLKKSAKAGKRLSVGHSARRTNATIKKHHQKKMRDEEPADGVATETTQAELPEKHPAYHSEPTAYVAGDASNLADKVDEQQWKDKTGESPISVLEQNAQEDALSVSKKRDPMFYDECTSCTILNTFPPKIGYWNNVWSNLDQKCYRSVRMVTHGITGVRDPQNCADANKAAMISKTAAEDAEAEKKAGNHDLSKKEQEQVLNTCGLCTGLNKKNSQTNTYEPTLWNNMWSLVHQACFPARARIMLGSVGPIDPAACSTTFAEPPDHPVKFADVSRKGLSFKSCDECLEMNKKEDGVMVANRYNNVWNIAFGGENQFDGKCFSAQEAMMGKYSGIMEPELCPSSQSLETAQMYIAKATGDFSNLKIANTCKGCVSLNKEPYARNSWNMAWLTEEKKCAKSGDKTLNPNMITLDPAFCKSQKDEGALASFKTASARTHFNVMKNARPETALKHHKKARELSKSQKEYVNSLPECFWKEYETFLNTHDADPKLKLCREKQPSTNSDKIDMCAVGTVVRSLTKSGRCVV